MLEKAGKAEAKDRREVKGERAKDERRVVRGEEQLKVPCRRGDA